MAEANNPKSVVSDTLIRQVPVGWWHDCRRWTLQKLNQHVKVKANNGRAVMARRTIQTLSVCSTRLVALFASVALRVSMEGQTISRVAESVRRAFT